MDHLGEPEDPEGCQAFQLGLYQLYPFDSAEEGEGEVALPTYILRDVSEEDVGEPDV